VVLTVAAIGIFCIFACFGDLADAFSRNGRGRRDRADNSIGTSRGFVRAVSIVLYQGSPTGSIRQRPAGARRAAADRRAVWCFSRGHEIQVEFEGLGQSASDGRIALSSPSSDPAKRWARRSAPLPPCRCCACNGRHRQSPFAHAVGWAKRNFAHLFFGPPQRDGRSFATSAGESYRLSTDH